MFFCGAGVSQSVGLPGFKCLVRKVLTHLLPAQEACPAGDVASLAWAALDRNEYDDALGLLESSNPGTFNRKKVREHIRTHLSKKVEESAAHKALIQLSGLDRGKGRLVTTNFDRLFEATHASLLSGDPHVTPLALYVAPALPPAKPGAFHGLLYLHGRLDPERTDDDKNLVLTKSDFGSGYMLDGWARRFIVDLFRHYHVVFVGYSVEDPTMRYLLSAMAAVRAEAPTLFRTPYSLASYRASGDGADKQRSELTWRSKGVQPILYAKYAELWDSIQSWADQHKGGLTAHKQTVVRLSQVTLTGKDDNRIAEMTWALRKPEVAKYFSSRVQSNRPNPSWIAPLQEHGLLSRSADPPHASDAPGAPLASRQLADIVATGETTAHLSRWIAQCLDDRRTLSWALSEGSVLHSTLRRNIRWALEEAQPEFPIALRRIWRVLASDDYAASLSRMNATTHSSLQLCKGLSAEQHFARITLLHWLRPVPVFHMQEPGFGHTQPDFDADPALWYATNLSLEGIQHKGDIEHIQGIAADWDGTLAEMADALTDLLLEAMHWLREFGLATDELDPTYINYRSIRPHEQNDITPTWTELIGLCRDAHQALIGSGRSARARRLVDRWRSESYPVFRRLALHAATNSVVDTDLGLDLMLGGTHSTLWDPCTRRETLRFLRRRGADIPEEGLGVLLRETLRGPPREPYFGGLTDDQWNRLCGNEIRLRLQKLQEAGVSLPEEASETYETLPADGVTRPRRGGSYPEEFNTFISFGWGGVPGFEDTASMGELREWPVAEFVQWAEKHGKEPWIRRTAWENLVKQDQMAAARRLSEAGDQSCWPSTLWSELLHITRESRNGGDDTVREVGKALRRMPSEALANVSVEAARWLRGNRTTLEASGRLRVWHSIWAASLSADDARAAAAANFGCALNHAGGILGEVLYAELADDISGGQLHRGRGLPTKLRQEFALVGEGDSLSARLARISLAVRLVELYRLDPAWTDRALLSRMGDQSKSSANEIGLWEGYFAGGQCSEGLLVAFKARLLGVLCDLERLPTSARARAVHHFIHLAIWHDRDISRDDAKAVAWAWDQTSLAEAAWAISEVLASAGNRADVLWSELVGSWFHTIWPGRENDKTPAVSEALCRIALAVDVTFPDVVEAIGCFLVPNLRDDTLDLIARRTLARRHPRSTATLLDRIIGDSDDEDSRETARRILEDAIEVEPSLRDRPEFGPLRQLLETDTASETD